MPHGPVKRLTEPRLRALRAIRDFTLERGYAPSQRQLSDFMGYPSHGSVQQLVAALRRLGFAQITKSGRGVELTPEGELYLANPGQQT